jgi:hypothetical protein
MQGNQITASGIGVSLSDASLIYPLIYHGLRSERTAHMTSLTIVPGRPHPCLKIDNLF